MDSVQWANANNFPECENFNFNTPDGAFCEGDYDLDDLDNCGTVENYVFHDSFDSSPADIFRWHCPAAYTWGTTDWSPAGCPIDCGLGESDIHRTREIFCLNDLGKVSPDSDCVNAGVKPS
eukprot:UN30097